MSRVAQSLPAISRETALVVSLVGGAEFVNHTYLVLFPPILGVLSEEFGVSLAMLGVAMGVQGAANTVFQLPFGYLSDNYDRRLALGLSLGLSTASVFVVAFAPTFEVLLVGQALLGVGIAGHHPAHFPLLADATPEHLRARAFSVRGFLGSLGFGAPPVLYAATLGVSGITWREAVALVGAFGAVYAAATLFVFQRYVGEGVTAPGSVDPQADGETSTGSTTAGSRRAAVRRELRAVLASPGVLGLALLALVASTASWGVTSYAVVLLQQGYGLALDAANLTLSATFVVGALAVLVGGDLSDRFSPGPLIVGSYAAVVVFVGLLASTTIPALAAVACLLLVGGTRALAGPARSKLADDLAARSDLGRTFAVITVGTMTGSALAPPLFGALIERSGLRVAFGAIAAISALAVLVTLFVLHRRKGRRERPSEVGAEQVDFTAAYPPFLHVSNPLERVSWHSSPSCWVVSTSRRRLLRSMGAAVVAVASSTTAVGAGGRRRPETPTEDSNAECEPGDGDYPAVEGYVFYPETYLACSPFRIGVVSRTFRTSVGPGPTACHRDRREFVAYGIAYEDAELNPDQGGESNAGAGIEGGLSTFLAVPTPAVKVGEEDGADGTGEEDPPLPHDYFLPEQRFQFTSAGDEVVFHARCSEPTTPMQEATFSTVE